MKQKQLGLHFSAGELPWAEPMPWYCRKCNAQPLIMPGDGRPTCALHRNEVLVRERPLLDQP